MKRTALTVYLLTIFSTQIFAQGNWQKRFTTLNPVNERVLCPYFINSEFGFIFTVGPTVSLYRTANGGKSWAKITNFSQYPNGQIHNMYFVTPQTGYLTAGLFSTTAIYKTVDSGITWELLSQVSPPSEVIYVHDGIIYGSSGKYSTDDGQTWITPLSYFKGCEAIAGNKENAVVAAMMSTGGLTGNCLDGGGQLTTDNGQSWHMGQKKDESYSIYSVPHTFVYFRSSESTSADTNETGGGSTK
jgi:photosystem II stability/assembly factor-like uncharacterized protein